MHHGFNLLYKTFVKLERCEGRLNVMPAFRQSFSFTRSRLPVALMNPRQFTARAVRPSRACSHAVVLCSWSWPAYGQSQIYRSMRACKKVRAEYSDSCMHSIISFIVYCYRAAAPIIYMWWIVEISWAQYDSIIDHIILMTLHP